MNKHKFYKVTTATPIVSIGNVEANCQQHIDQK